MQHADEVRMSSSADTPMPVLPWVVPDPPLPASPALEPREPRPLGPAALLEFRDSMHEDSVVYAASGAEIDVWLQQLDDAIDAGTLDPRPSWEIEAAEQAERVAAMILAQLGGSSVATEIAGEVARRLGGATKAEFITLQTSEQVVGAPWRWVVDQARRLGVPILGSDRRALIDLAAFRAALAKEAEDSAAGSTDDLDPAEQIRRMLGSALAKGAGHGH